MVCLFFAPWLATCAVPEDSLSDACGSVRLMLAEQSGAEPRSSIAARCLSRALEPDENGQVACVVLEGRALGGACTCDGGRRPLPPERQSALRDIWTSRWQEPNRWDCLCEVAQLEHDDLYACQHDVAPEPQVDGQPVSGWCYVDAATIPAIGAPSFVATCPDTMKHDLRFVGDAVLPPGATRLTVCDRRHRCGDRGDEAIAAQRRSAADALAGR